MKLRSFSRFFAEAFQSIRRNWGMSIASVATVALTLFVCGVFALIVLNINNLAGEIESTVEIQAFLEEEATVEQEAQAEQDILAISGVEAVTFVPKEEALETMAKRMGETYQSLLDSLGENPLPDSYMVQVKTADDVVPTAELLEGIATVSEVKYGEGTVEKMFYVLNWVRYFGIGIIAFLVIFSVFIVAFNIKLTVASRKWEIVIMRYVGASNWYIRWPFCIAGMVLGLIGAIIACALLYGGYAAVLSYMGGSFVFFSLIRPDLSFLYMYGAILVIGLLLGAIGSLLSLNVYLKERSS